MTAEWRVVWRRQGGPRRVRRVRNEARGHAFASYLEGDYERSTGHKRDDYVCCNGGSYNYECGCHGETWGERWDNFLTRDGHSLDPIMYARVEYRPVGKWTRLGQQSNPVSEHPSSETPRTVPGPTGIATEPHSTPE